MKRTLQSWATAILACAMSVALSIPVVLARDPGSGSSGRNPQMEMKMQDRPILQKDDICICKKTSSTGDSCSSGYYWNCRDSDNKTCGKDGNCT